MFTKLHGNRTVEQSIQVPRFGHRYLNVHATLIVGGLYNYFLVKIVLDQDILEIEIEKKYMFTHLAMFHFKRTMTENR